jgi:hypothetical protein
VIRAETLAMLLSSSPNLGSFAAVLSTRENATQPGFPLFLRPQFQSVSHLMYIFAQSARSGKIVRSRAQVEQSHLHSAGSAFIAWSAVILWLGYPATQVLSCLFVA